MQSAFSALLCRVMGLLLSLLLFSVKVNPLLGLIRSSAIISMLLLISELLLYREVGFLICHC